MKTLEVLCVTMHQNDFSKIKEMNISGNIVFANQTDCTDYKEIMHDGEGHVAKMVSTTTRGVGRNRNIALLYATADILLFADDDVTYFDGYEQKVLDMYEKYPKADLIIFSLDITKNGEVIRKISNKNKKLRFYEALKYGTCVCSIKRESLQKANLWFSTLFGGGTDFGHGEDTLFIMDAFSKSLNVYSSSSCLGTCSKDSSTCFTGYDEKYFFDQGVFYACAFKRWAYFMSVQFCVRKYKRYKDTLTLSSAFKNMKKGMAHFRKKAD